MTGLTHGPVREWNIFLLGAETTAARRRHFWQENFGCAPSCGIINEMHSRWPRVRFEAGAKLETGMTRPPLPYQVVTTGVLRLAQAGLLKQMLFEMYLRVSEDLYTRVEDISSRLHTKKGTTS